jgi:hypothetical protein
VSEALAQGVILGVTSIRQWPPPLFLDQVVRGKANFDRLPQQRLSEVVSMPDKPEGLEVQAEFLESYPHYPVGTPRKLLFLGGVELSSSPKIGHSISRKWHDPLHTGECHEKKQAQ